MMSVCIIMLSTASVSVKARLHGLAAQSTVEAQLMAAALTIKESLDSSHTMKEPGCGMLFGSVPQYILTVPRLCTSPATGIAACE